MVAGSLLWGKVANLWSVQAALIVSSLALVPLTVLAASIRLARLVDAARLSATVRARSCVVSTTRAAKILPTGKNPLVTRVH